MMVERGEHNYGASDMLVTGMLMLGSGYPGWSSWTAPCRASSLGPPKLVSGSNGAPACMLVVKNA
jgi:hypothetical protein